MKTGYEKSESEKTLAALLILREALRQVADWKIAKINGYALRAGESGRTIYQIGGGKILPKEIQSKILDKLLGLINDLGLSAIAERSASDLSQTVSIDLSRVAALSAIRGILESTAKAGLMCALVDGVIGSVESGYLASKGKMDKKDAVRHIIKEASGGAVSGAAGIGAVGMLTSLSPIPVICQIAVLTGVAVGVKRLWNKFQV